ncbi:MAG: polysaccharide deacetylase family protein [Rhodospirillales bacterium]|nr:polysaccharide deacetylase family protein [Rhodospirillales bacterium]
MIANVPGRPHGIMFHYFHDDAAFKAGQGTLTADDLEAILDDLGNERILGAEEWVQRARANRLSPGDLCLTFDHALHCQYAIALPILRRRGLTALWFVCTAALVGEAPPLEAYRRFRCEYFDTIDDFYTTFFRTAADRFPGSRVTRALREIPSDYLAEFAFYSASDRKFRYLRDRILSPEEYRDVMDRAIESRGMSVRELSDGVWLEADRLRSLKDEGHVVGLHSHSHPMLIGMETPESQYAEYKASRDILSDVLGKPPLTMSHPNNSYSRATLDILDDLGIALGFRSNMKMDGAPLLELPREDVADIGARHKIPAVRSIG